jgi:bifunctional enzyme CysN/CysC
VLVDARNGVVEQSRRHAFIASLLRIPHLVVAVNKMDLVDWDEEVFDRIVADFSGWAAKLDITDITFIPMSALMGDNVVDRSKNMDWYDGPSLLYYLEHVHIASDRNLIDCRFPVQWVIRPMDDEHHDYRGYAGQVASGVIAVGDEVVIQPSGVTTRIAGIDTQDGPLQEAYPPLSVTVRLADDVDVSRGDMICRVNNKATATKEVEATVCWMSERPLSPSGRYRIKHTTRTALAKVDDLRYRFDVNSMHRDEDATGLALNEIGRVRLRLSAPLLVDEYRRNRATGSFVLIEESTNDTVGAGMILGADED